ncbi:tRNA modification GTPase [Flavivirga rizhaonensis]|uniref:tRNA modification GTPase n=1 Tax=Flavivirga rizhaonensis TaxID=2559571 RepID=A0A4S1E0K4_9FLAO|nr:tRNA modification GTPase [Flavivirga rizhaonensis]TGV04067.1 tRNA modification GTPase [Flavivirga rizhaonensis]
MKKQLLLLFISVLSINIHSQITFEKGYYINNSNQKIECLIKNKDSRNNPTTFDYRLSEEREEKVLTINDVKELGIYNIVKYIRFEGKIDKSSMIMSRMSNTKNPEFQKETLFLKVLIEGKASLYSYEEPNLLKFFYKNENSKISQLVFKNYMPVNNVIYKNERYKQQLLNDLKCGNITMNQIKNLEYEKNRLISFFKKYNNCNNSENITFEKKQKKDIVNLTLRPGFKNSSLKIENSNFRGLSLRDTDFDNELGFRLGLEVELIMPYNRNKWSLIIEPTYQYYKSEKEYSDRSVTKITVDYKSIGIPIGIRHYLFLNNNSKLFINGSAIFDLSSDSSIVFDLNGAATAEKLEIQARPNMAFGFGYKHHDKYSLELRYHTNRNVLNKYRPWNSKYSTLSLIFGYSLF